MCNMRVLLLLACLAPALAHAGSAVSDLAPGQLRFAEALLEQAREAMAQGELQRARQLAAQAARDARLAYGMTDSPFLRRDAVQVHEESARLRYRAHPAGVSARR